MGESFDHNQQARNALAAPAIKLFTCGRREGRYKKPEPEEWGGIMKIS
jgi:hypothetical protein